MSCTTFDGATVLVGVVAAGRMADALANCQRRDQISIAGPAKFKALTGGAAFQVRVKKLIVLSEDDGVHEPVFEEEVA